MITKNRYVTLVIIYTLILSACSSDPDINNNTMLDGDQIFDASIYNPKEYLISLAINNPSDVEKNTPVIIAVHGYSASTFEWNEFKEYSLVNSSVLVSQVLLGGHGLTYEAFKDSSWKDWQTPILEEYNRLKEKGYTNINFAGSSTGCALMLDLIAQNKINDNGMNQIFFIDPMLIPSNKLITLVGLFGPMIGYIETENTAIEENYWYHFRPQETINELLDLTSKVRKDLQKGFQLPIGTRMKVYKSIKDDVVDAVSAVLIYKGLKNNDGTPIDVEMIDSELHVVTRLEGRDNVTQNDRDLQKRIFEEMILKVNQ